MFRNSKALRAPAFAGLFLSLTLFSCGKKTKPDPETAVVLSDKALVGKWEVISVTTVDYRNDTLMGKYEFVKGVGGVQDGQPVGSDPWLWQTQTTYITFQDSHSYFHTDIEGNPDGYMLTQFLPFQGGTWSIRNTEQMNLTTKDYVGVNRPARQLVWEVVAFNGSYISMGTLDTATMDGAKYSSLLTLELERK